jgi:uncharacterized protein (DUF4213/DUF364 family)
MSIQTELGDMARELTSIEAVPKIENIALPLLFEGGQPADCEFMALALEGGAAGISYVAIPDEMGDQYRALRPSCFAGTRPEAHAADFGCGDPVRNMIALAAINAICQHVMRSRGEPIDHTTDSLGLMKLRDGDRVGMVGLFRPLLKYLEAVDAELVIVEKNEALIRQHPDLPITLDPMKLRECNKILCTSTVVLNNTVDAVLGHCSDAEHVAVLGPTAGYFPDPLFARNVDVVGGRYVRDGPLLLKRIAERKRWGAATQKLCFQKRKLPQRKR